MGEAQRRYREKRLRAGAKGNIAKTKILSDRLRPWVRRD
jgi:hypothetical protein